jgi:hypothetical protein
MKYSDIPMMTRCGSYEPSHDLRFLESTIKTYTTGEPVHGNLDLNPDFQRGHVWTTQQRIAFMEFFLRGGMTGRVIYLNCPNWGTFEHIPKGGYRDFVIVDGLQRLTTLLMFVRGQLPVFGGVYVLPAGTDPEPGKEYFTEPMRMMGASGNLKININNLKTKDAVLRWYLEMNEGGTPHTRAELDKVRGMLAKEKS